MTLTKLEKEKIEAAVKLSNFYDDAVANVESVLLSLGWKWKKGVWGYADAPWTALVKNGSRAHVQISGGFRTVRCQIRDLTGDKLEEEFELLLPPQNMAVENENDEYSVADDFSWC